MADEAKSGIYDLYSNIEDLVSRRTPELHKYPLFGGMGDYSLYPLSALVYLSEEYGINKDKTKEYIEDLSVFYSETAKGKLTRYIGKVLGLFSINPLFLYTGGYLLWAGCSLLFGSELYDSIKLYRSLNKNKFIDYIKSTQSYKYFKKNGIDSVKNYVKRQYTHIVSKAQLLRDSLIISLIGAGSIEVAIKESNYSILALGGLFAANLIMNGYYREIKNYLKLRKKRLRH